MKIGVLSIHSELKKQFPSVKIDHHHTDLYVKYSKEVWDWLRKHYERPQAVTTFVAADGSGAWIEVPFAYSELVNMLGVLKKGIVFKIKAKMAAGEETYKPVPDSIEFGKDPASGLVYAIYDGKIHVKGVGVFSTKKLRAFAEKMFR